MPKSKSKRRTYQPPPRKKPKPSPKWFGVVILSILGLGVVVILAYYGLLPFIPGAKVAGNHPYLLYSGLGMFALGFGLATRWR